MPAEAEDGLAPDAHLTHEAQPSIPETTLMWRSPWCGAVGSCVEIANLPEGKVGLRDGKSGDSGPVLVFSATEWQAFTAAIKAGGLG